MGTALATLAAARLAGLAAARARAGYRAVTALVIIAARRVVVAVVGAALVALAVAGLAGLATARARASYGAVTESSPLDE